MTPSYKRKTSEYTTPSYKRKTSSYTTPSYKRKDVFMHDFFLK